NAHGYRRVTVDVDVLLTREGLTAFKQRHLGKRGYVERSPGSKKLRDTELNVNIDVLLTGEYPGDRKPKPVTFPDPAVSAERIDDIAVLPLAQLLELKLASGISTTDRIKDLADVLEIVFARKLPRDLAKQLSPYVQEKYVELWDAAQTRKEDDY